MRIMAILTGWRAGITVLSRMGVHARTVARGLTFMTNAAIDGFGGNIIVGMLICQVGMATGASVGMMSGGGEFGCVYKK